MKAATTKGPLTVVAFDRCGDWAVTESFKCADYAHFCGGGSENGPGYTVTYIPTGRALVEHIARDTDARSLAKEVDGICPAGTDPNTRAAALREAALRVATLKQSGQIFTALKGAPK